MTPHFAAAKRIARRSSAGFTLIELMIVAAIVAILAAMAMNAYGTYVARGRRADARNQLLQAAQFMQQFYSANDSYIQDRATPPNPVFGQIPQALKQSPADTTAIYTLAVTPTPAPSPPGYTMSMTPVAGGPMAADTCGAFTITSTGVRGFNGMTVIGTGDTAQRDTCWK